MARFIASPCNILKVYINIDVYNMRRTIKVGLIQQSCTGNTAENMDKLKHSIEDVASKGAELVVLQELHNTLYFCQTENTSLFDLAETIPGPSTEFYSGIASANGIVLVTSLFEKRAIPLADAIVSYWSLPYLRNVLRDFTITRPLYSIKTEVLPGSIEKCIFRTIRHIMKNSISLRGI